VEDAAALFDAGPPATLARAPACERSGTLRFSLSLASIPIQVYCIFGYVPELVDWLHPRSRGTAVDCFLFSDVAWIQG
jgi:hypothetical protein